jgi:hypothetical protein
MLSLRPAKHKPTVQTEHNLWSKSTAIPYQTWQQPNKRVRSKPKKHKQQFNTCVPLQDAFLGDFEVLHYTS